MKKYRIINEMTEEGYNISQIFKIQKRVFIFFHRYIKNKQYITIERAREEIKYLNSSVVKEVVE